jgi:Stress responsive A/B Barrel Domain
VIAHVVLFRPRADLSAQARQSLVDAFSTALRDIPSIRRARIGRRLRRGYGYESLMRVDYDFLAILEFDDDNGLRAYLEHPAHQQLANSFFASFEEALMYDFELEDGTEGIRELP